MGLLNSLNTLFVKKPTQDDLRQALAREAARHTLLIIDDNKEFLETCGGILREAGYNVLKSSAGSKALNMLRYAPKDISLILLDFDMPQLDGNDTLSFIRKIAPDVKVAGVTGVDPKILPHGYVDGMAGMLPKPFDAAQLLEFVRKILSPTPAAASSAVAQG